MNSIAFVLATRELFVTGRSVPSGSSGSSSSGLSGSGALADAEVQPIAEPRLIRELRRLGWPAEARLCDPREAGSGEAVPGVLVELLDALPVLAAPTEEEDEGPELLAFRQAARLGLELMIAGAALPRVRARSGGRLGWEARWRSLPVAAAQRAKVVRIGELLPALTAVPAGATWKFQGAVPLNGQRLLYRLLDACADMLVREASRRGALVRLGSWPATTWEQQLVRALGEDRATFRCPDPAAAELCAKDVNDWVQDQLKAAALALLPSPAGWAAPETLAQVLARLLAPAAQLAQTLRSGRPAPRMLPTATWLPEKTGAVPRLRQAAA